MQNNLTNKLFTINKNIEHFNIKFSDKYIHDLIITEICMYHK